MRRLFLCLMAYLIVALSFKVVSADEPTLVNDEVRIEKYISELYKQIDLSKCEHLSFEVFSKAVRGYINLKNAGKLSSEKDILSIADLSLSSTANRLWVIDLVRKKVIFNTYVAHGQGSGDDMATEFSNRLNSHQTSLGFYVTTDIYDGEHGTSLHLQGMDQGFNDKAYERDIVVHGADYVCDKYINANNRLGRSWGCPAVAEKLALPIINTIKDGTCLFIYAPEHRYLSASYWMNKKVASLPGNDLYGDIIAPEGLHRPRPRMRTVEYRNDKGGLDSVKTFPVLN